MRALAALASASLMMSPVAVQADAMAELVGSTYRGTATVEAVSQPDGDPKSAWWSGSSVRPAG